MGVAIGVVDRRRGPRPDLPRRGDPDPARVRARRDLPARPPDRPEGPRPDPPDPDHRPDGPGRPADGDAQRAAAGGDHEGQRHRPGERGRLLPRRSTPTRPSPRSRTSCSPRRRSRRRRCGRCSARPSSTRCSAERERLNIELQQIIDEQTEPWGIKVSTVEVKDVELPQDMQRAIAAPGGGRARAARQDHRRRGRVPGGPEALPGREHHQPEPGDAPAPLPADAAADRRRTRTRRSSSRCRSTC